MRKRCGFASVSNIKTMQTDDRMESFFLSETLKYLYLLFDEGKCVRISLIDCQRQYHSQVGFQSRLDDR